MARDTRSSAEIERDIEHEREGLQRSLGELGDKVSIGGLIDQVNHSFRREGGNFGRSFYDGVKANPLGVMVTAAGLGLMMMSGREGGPGMPRLRRRRHEEPHVPDLDPHRLPESGPRETPEGELDLPEPYSGPRTRVPEFARRPDASWHGALEMDDPLHDDPLYDPLMDEPVAPPETEEEHRRGLSDRARDLKDAAGERAGRLREGGRNRRAAASARARRMRERLSHGTERLSEAGRDRVIAARRRAESAQHRAQRIARRGGRNAQEYYDGHPIAVGALALALGAAFGALLPGTRREDARFGATRDRLFDEAERIFEEERAKAGVVADAAVDEARKVGDETAAEVDEKTPEGTSAVDAAEERVRSAAKRVADRAGEEADHQDLGRRKK